MTRTIFLEDCYLREMDATVTEAEGNKVVLDQSIFCYQGGGQLADQGTLTTKSRQFSVIDVRKESGKIIHYLDHEGLTAGDNVHCTLNWKRRYILMRSHTALHLLAAVIHQKTGALITGGQIDLERTRVDFSLEDLDREKIAAYIQEANNAIKRNMAVKTYFLPREEALKIPGMVKLANAAPPAIANLRIVEIGDVDTQADGGTHVANTCEIGRIELLKIENNGKRNRRLYFKLVL